ncbi:hypothetical protein [Methylobacterium sp. 77]|uniref:hypothetical protein n=1 Tax=Methylobacterium sp. 77 TaxID=1101192 RepID=UPI00036F7AF7|nr:hypothetical protein [Methylobacterium sp. 77]
MKAILGAKHIVPATLRTGAPFRAAILKSFEVIDDSGGTVLTMPFDNVVVLGTKPSMKRTGVWHNQLPQPQGKRDVHQSLSVAQARHMAVRCSMSRLRCSLFVFSQCHRLYAALHATDVLFVAAIPCVPFQASY